MKDLGLIIDLNQPLIYEESVVKKSITDFYNPLIRVLKAYKNFNFSINIPLSTLEMLEKHGGSSFISDLKELYQNERVEIVNSSPYGLSLFGLSKNIVESQIMFNEYGLGYYLGSTKGFEGEPSIMLRDALGFFPANYAFDEVVLKVLANFGYSWFALKGESLKKDIVEILLEDGNLKVVGAFDDLNKLIYLSNKFKGSENDIKEAEAYDESDSRNILVKIEGIIKNYTDAGMSSVVFRIGEPDFIPESNSDYKDILNRIESIFDAFSKANYLVKTVGDIVKSKNKPEKIELVNFCKSMSEINSSRDTQSTVKLNLDKNAIKILDDRLSLILNSDKKYESSVNKIWEIEEIKTLIDIQLRNNMFLLLSISKILPLIEIKQSKLNIENTEKSNYEQDFNEKSDYVSSELMSYIDDQELTDLIKNYI